eukprot:SAG11_NODE_11046_length_787_cov_1.284884_1_plen_115_part_10
MATGRLQAVGDHLHCMTDVPLPSPCPAAATTTDAAAAPDASIRRRRLPDGSWSAELGSDPALEADVAFFRRECYLKLPALISGELLARAQAAFRAAQPAARHDWLDGLVAGAASG